MYFKNLNKGGDHLEISCQSENRRGWSLYSFGKKCPLGNDVKHFNDRKEAEKDSEKVLSALYDNISTINKKKNSETLINSQNISKLSFSHTTDEYGIIFKGPEDSFLNITMTDRNFIE